MLSGGIRPPLLEIAPAISSSTTASASISGLSRSATFVSADGVMGGAIYHELVQVVLVAASRARSNH
jgi:hypothetical protein